MPGALRGPVSNVVGPRAVVIGSPARTAVRRAAPSTRARLRPARRRRRRWRPRYFRCCCPPGAVTGRPGSAELHLQAPPRCPGAGRRRGRRACRRRAVQGCRWRRCAVRCPGGAGRGARPRETSHEGAHSRCPYMADEFGDELPEGRGLTSMTRGPAGGRLISVYAMPRRPPGRRSKRGQRGPFGGLGATAAPAAAAGELSARSRWERRCLADALVGDAHHLDGPRVRLTASRSPRDRPAAPPAARPDSGAGREALTGEAGQRADGGGEVAPSSSSAARLMPAHRATGLTTSQVADLPCRAAARSGPYLTAKRGRAIRPQVRGGWRPCGQAVLRRASGRGRAGRRCPADRHGRQVNGGTSARRRTRTPPCSRATWEAGASVSLVSAVIGRWRAPEQRVGQCPQPSAGNGAGRG